MRPSFTPGGPIKPMVLPFRSPKSSTLAFSGATITTGSVCRMATALIRSDAGPSARITASSASPLISLPRASWGPLVCSILRRTVDFSAVRLRLNDAINAASANPAGPTATLRMVGFDRWSQAATMSALVTRSAIITSIQRQGLLTAPQRISQRLARATGSSSRIRDRRC
jgi:hypothetical protein